VCRKDLIFLAWFFLPIAAVILLHSTVYDAWRQLFFIYPAMIVLALTGFEALLRRTGRKLFLKVLLLGMLALDMASTLFFMVRSHPYQMVYFNPLASLNGKEPKKNFEMDYWGLSYRQTLAYITQHDRRPFITIYADTTPGKYNALLLPASDRRRLQFTDSLKDADYFISTYRSHPEEYLLPNEVYSVRVRNSKIAVVHQLRPVE
jgi:hypothetical protein